MKPFFITLLAMTAVAFAEPEAKTSPAEEFLKITHYEEMIIASAVANFDEAAKQMKTQGVTDEAIKEIREEAQKMYVSIFTGPEIRKGQKSLTVMGTLSAEAMKLAMPGIQEQAPLFQKKIGEIIDKHKKPGE
jgi:hypothetical protein